jgi:hypothetical protein
MLNILSSSSVGIFNQFMEGMSRELILFGFLQQVQVSLRRGTIIANLWNFGGIFVDFTFTTFILILTFYGFPSSISEKHADLLLHTKYNLL